MSIFRTGFLFRDAHRCVTPIEKLSFTTNIAFRENACRANLYDFAFPE